MKKVFFIILCVIAILSGCAATTDAGKPEIPADIKTDDGSEPSLQVYNAETEQIEEMKFEEYIAGVVAAEMDVNWSIEALKAQAILARTFTLQKIAQDGGVPDRGAHASTDIEEFQAYDATKVNDNVSQAVDQTRGQILAYQSEYIRSWFHAYSGGYTATAIEGLAYDKDETPYIQSVEDPGKNVASSEVKEWTVELSKADISQKVSAETGQQINEFDTISIAESGPSGRATKLQIGNVTVSAPLFRLAMGSTDVKSTFISDIQSNGNTIVISGTGYGHGVGMSQWGAKAMAEEGKNAEEIVKYFFKDVELFTMWN